MPYRRNHHRRTCLVAAIEPCNNGGSKTLQQLSGFNSVPSAAEPKVNERGKEAFYNFIDPAEPLLASFQGIRVLVLRAI